MGTDFDAVKRAVVSCVAVMAAFGNGALNTGVAFGIHSELLYCT